MTQFGKRLIKGLKEAVAVAKGKSTPARVYTDVDVAKIRAKLKLSQSEFAETRRPRLGTSGAPARCSKWRRKNPPW